MIRNVFRCWLASLLLGPACAFALEVGEIQVDSALNQLFDARIPLPMLSPEELGRISVKVASPTMFKEFGLDRGTTLDNLVFSIQYDAEGKVYVKVVSIKPIHEPSLALLLEFGWPRGKTFREFTVLLDPVQRLARQPAGRTKTVLDTPADAGDEPASEPPSADIVVNRTIQYPNGPAPSAEGSSSAGGRWVYRPGDVYGPVAPGEGLWGIALKIRPDPGITRDQMMQALFQANPEAFTKAGIDGLRIGALLRIPTFQEIADFTGSAVARQLAMEQAAKLAAEQAAPAANGAEADIASAGERPAKVTEPLATAGASASHLAVFPLPRPAALEPASPVAEPKPEAPAPAPEPVAVAVAEPKPEAPAPAPEPVAVAVAEPKPEAPAPAPEPAAVAVAEPKPEAPALAPEPVAVAVAEPKPEAPAPEPAAVAVAEPKPEAPAPEPVAVAVAEPKPAVAEPDPALSAAGSELVKPMVMGPVSATPLLFLVVSEVMASATAQIPHTPLSPRIPSDARIVDTVASEPVPEPDIDAAAPSGHGLQTTVEPGAVSQATHGTPTVVAADRSESPPVVDSAGSPVVEFTVPPAVEPTEIVRAAESATPPVAEFAAPPAVEIAKAVQAAEVTEAVDSAPVKPVKPAATAYKGGEQYGPVAPNERLWDIAAKVRPAPDIGIDTMMRALFAINPSAFAKAGMDYLKVGVILRVPTLREIVDHTHSKVVKQLLEQQATTSKEVGPADSTQTPLPPPPAAASTTGSEPEPKPEPRSSAVN